MGGYGSKVSQTTVGLAYATNLLISEIHSMEDQSIGFIKTMFVQIVLEYPVTA